MKITNTQNFLAALLAVLASTLTTSLVAQEDTNTVATAKPAESPERPPYRPWTVGIGVGTDALIGGGVSWRFSDHLGARAGFGWTESSWDAVGIAGLKYDIKARLMAEPLTLDLYPWKKNSFHLSLGMQFNQNELSGSVSSAGTITVDGTPVLIPAGSLTMKIKPQLVNPYIGIGGNLFYFDRAHHWGMGGELGVSYTGDTQVSLERSRASSVPGYAVDKIKHRLQNYGDQFQWWPVLKLAVTYSF